MPRFIGSRLGHDDGWSWVLIDEEGAGLGPPGTRVAIAILLLAIAALLVMLSLGGPDRTVAAEPVPGAIFTTTPDGAVVNANVSYQDKREVYLDGGPPPNAPQTAAGLNDGHYVFQVTDPSGKLLLSEDPARCRVVRVEDGVIVELVPPTSVPGLGATTDNWADSNGPNANEPCHVADPPHPPAPAGPGDAGSTGRHDTNVDVDHGPPAIVVQLMPYGTTPNPGNVYKAWITPLSGYLNNGGDLNKVPKKLAPGQQKPHRCPDFCAAADPGFGPARAQVKTDNFKVKEAPVPPPILHVLKCNDRNGNGVMDLGDPLIDGWAIEITDPLSVTNPYATPVWIIAEPPGIWVIEEEEPQGWVHTLTLVDGVPKVDLNGDPANPVSVTVGADDVTVIFCNFNPASLTACKFYDFDQNGVQEGPLEVNLADWPMTLTGETFEGVPVGPVTQNTGVNGCTTFDDLIEGEYEVCEETPVENNWSHTTPTCVQVVLSPGQSETVRFGNVCVVAFPGGLTMGYWKTHTGLTSPPRDPTYDLLPIMLGISPEDGFPEQVIDDEAEAKAVFDLAQAATNNGVLMLKAQLLAAKLNVLKFPGFDQAQFPDGSTVGDAIAEADQILDDLANGILHSKAEIIAVKDLLDAANNNSHTNILGGPSPAPCVYSFD